MRLFETTFGGWGRAGRLGLLLSGLLLAALPARADSDPSNDSDNFTISLLPVVDVGVIIDTTGAAWAGDSDLDVDMEMAAEKLLTAGVKLTVVGNFNNQELQLAGAANNTWTLDTDESRPLDELSLAALIGADQGTAPASALFNGTQNLVTATPTRAGQTQANEAGDSGHVYEFSTSQSPQYADVDGMNVGAIRRLWLRAKTPTLTSSADEQQFTITVTAVSGTGQ